MRLAYLLGALCVSVLTIAPVAAAEADWMANGKMHNSTAMAVMPDGRMGSMKVSDDATGRKMMGMAKPIAGCTMILSDKDGKMSVVDTSTAEAKAECEKLAATPPAAAAADASTETAGKMRGDRAMAMMPDGHVGAMHMTDAATATKMRGMAKAATGCTMMMTDRDGKISMLDTSSAEAKAECEKTANMKSAQ
jgi:hypothetical protein